MKICTKCDQQKDAEQFFRDKSKKDGRSPSCKDCYKKHYSVIRASKLVKKKAYREKNSARIAAYRAEHYIRNQARAVEYATEWAKANPNSRRVVEAARRARKNSSVGKFTASDLSQIVEAQKWKCACCKCSIKGGYHADHIDPLARGGSNDKYNIQALCPTCNMNKKAKDPYVFMQSRGYLL